jgi:hypothetical protein
MSDNHASMTIGSHQPSYASWRGKLLAELALARVPGLVVHKRPDRAPADLPYDYLVATEHGACFFVEVNAFASFRMRGHRGDIRLAPELCWAVDGSVVNRVRADRSPYFLFLFDADTEHGRYLRLDTLPEPKDELLQVRFPVENTITKESLARLIEELEKAAKP